MTTWSLLRMRRCTQAQILHSEAFRVIFGGQAVCQRFWGTPKMLTFQWQVEWRKCAWYGSIGVTLLGCHHSGGECHGSHGSEILELELEMVGGTACKTLSLYNPKICDRIGLSRITLSSFFDNHYWGYMVGSAGSSVNRYPARSWTVCPWKVTFPIGKDHLPPTIFRGEHVKLRVCMMVKTPPMFEAISQQMREDPSCLEVKDGKFTP